MRGIDDLIATSAVFAGLRADQLQLIAGCGRLERAPAGTRLLREGAPADRFYLIRHGSVAIEVRSPNRGELVIETLHDGDVLGWSWLFEPYRWQFDGRAAGDCELVSFDAACLRGKCDADHELGYQLMRRFAAVMTARLQGARLQLLDLYGHAGAPV